jgi:hypothetical protein
MTLEGRTAPGRASLTSLVSLMIWAFVERRFLRRNLRRGQKRNGEERDTYSGSWTTDGLYSSRRGGLPDRG